MAASLGGAGVGEGVSEITSPPYPTPFQRSSSVRSTAQDQARTSSSSRAAAAAPPVCHDLRVRSIHRREVALALALAAIAGYLDAVGFLHLGGFFISFMSGNTTRAAADGATGEWLQAGRAAGLIGLFVAGVIAGSVLSRLRDGRICVLWATAAIVTGAAAARSAGVDVPAFLVVAAAMGLLNATFQRGGEVSIGVTYMTGTLVKAAQRLVDAFFGGSRTAWLRYAAMWLALTGGAILGAVMHTRRPADVLWIAAAALVATAAITTAVRCRRLPAPADHDP